MNLAQVTKFREATPRIQLRIIAQKQTRPTGIYRLWGAWRSRKFLELCLGRYIQSKLFELFPLFYLLGLDHTGLCSVLCVQYSLLVSSTFKNDIWSVRIYCNLSLNAVKCIFYKKKIFTKKMFLRNTEIFCVNRF